MAELVWKRFNMNAEMDSLDNVSVKNTVGSGGLNFSKWFTYQDQNLSNVHNSADEVEKMCHDRMERFLWKKISTRKVSNEEISTYIKWLDSKQKKIFTSLYDDGCSFNDAVAYMDAYNTNPDLFKNPVAPWVWKFEEAPSTWQSIAQWPIDTLTRPVRWMFNKASDVADWAADKLWVDEETIARNHTDFDELLRLPNADRESFAYDAAELWSDLAITELITSALAWPLWSVWWLALRSKKIKDFVTKYPKFMKYLWKFGKWVEDMTVLDAVEWETPNWWNQLFGWWVNVWLEAFGWKSVAWLKWIMNKSDAMNVLKSLADNWLEKVNLSLSQLWEFFNKIWAKWTRRQILNKLNNRKTKVITLKDELLGVSDDLFKSEEATQILNQLFEWYSKHPWSEWLLEEITKLISKSDEYTLKQLEKIRSMWQDSPLNPYLKNVVKETKDAWGTPWNLNLYNSVRKTINEWAEKLGIWNINELNKEIQITTEAIKWIENKIVWDQLKKELATYTTYWTIWWLANMALGWDFKKGAIYWLSIKWLYNLVTKPAVRSYISDALFKMKWWVRKELSDFIWKWWELSEEAYSKLLDILDKSKWKVKDEITKYLSNLGMGMARVATESAPDSAYEKWKDLLWK